MISLTGTRMFVFLTGDELPQVFPINNGRPLHDEPGLYTVLGKVTGECQGGVWLLVEKIFDRSNVEMDGDLSDKPEYLFLWGALRRALLAKDGSTQPPRQFVFRDQSGNSEGALADPDPQRR
jgi:hypothetical protein